MFKKFCNLFILVLILFTTFSCSANSPTDSNENGNNITQKPTDDNLTPPKVDDEVVIIPEYNVDNFDVYSGVENIENQTLQAQEILGDNSSAKLPKQRKNKNKSSDGLIENKFFVYQKDEQIFNDIRNGEIGYIFRDIFALLEINVLTGNARKDIVGKYYYLPSDKSTISQKYVYFDFLNDNFIDIDCPNCGETLSFLKNKTNGMCPECGTEFKIK